MHALDLEQQRDILFLQFQSRTDQEPSESSAQLHEKQHSDASLSRDNIWDQHRYDLLSLKCAIVHAGWVTFTRCTTFMETGWLLPGTLLSQLAISRQAALAGVH